MKINSSGGIYFVGWGDLLLSSEVSGMKINSRGERGGDFLCWEGYLTSPIHLPVGLFSQIVCLYSCFYIPLFLKDNNLFGNFAGTFGGYYSGGAKA